MTKTKVGLVANHMLFTDLYDLKMAASYLKQGINHPATFSLFARQLPSHRGFIVAAGIEECVDFVEGFGFSSDQLDYLETLGFDDEMLSGLASLRFSGEIYAVPEGRVVFAGEPLLEVRAPIAEAQLLGTYFLNQISTHSVLATKAVRCRLAVQGKMELLDFSARRAHGMDCALAVARTSAIAGFASTSNVDAARRYDLPASGTMAHSYVESFSTEKEAFYKFAQDWPNAPTFLVDTYDTIDGVCTAIDVIQALDLGERSAVRIDSGDLLHESVMARRLLDAAGLHKVKIVISGGLDEYELHWLVQEGAPIDVAAVGMKLGVAADAPELDVVYKLVDYDGRPVTKPSLGRSALPGAKQIFRSRVGAQDVLALRGEVMGDEYSPVLEQFVENGERMRYPDQIQLARARLESDLRRLPPECLRLRNPVGITPVLSPALQALAAEPISV